MDDKLYKMFEDTINMEAIDKLNKIFDSKVYK